MDRKRAPPVSGISPPLSITKSFEHLLPNLDCPLQKYTKVQPSGTTTGLAIPPAVLGWKPVKAYNTVAENFLKSMAIRDSTIINELTIPTELKGLFLKSEADVVIASMIYILVPIMEILSVLYPEQWNVLSEHSVFQKVVKEFDPAVWGDLETEELLKAASLRYDIVFKTSSNHKKPGKTTCILEYKKGGNVRFRDFERAMVYESKDVEFLICQGMRKSFLSDNAISYLKQIVTYAKNEKCRYTALFNWSHLLILDFHKVDKSPARSAGDIADLTWVCEHGGPDTTAADGNRSKVVEQEYIRKALLGWILNAYNNC